jgi:hypothetical protein
VLLENLYYFVYKFVSEEIFFKLSNTDRKNMHAAYFGDHRPTDHAPLKTYGIARLGLRVCTNKCHLISILFISTLLRNTLGCSALNPTIGRDQRTAIYLL